MAEDELRRVTIGEPTILNDCIVLADYDPDWPQQFEKVAAEIDEVLSDDVVLLEHVGSTSVPGLSAKPIIDMLLVVRDSSDEESYVPVLQTAGFVLRIREPEWYEHRLLTLIEPATNLHVFTIGSAEIGRMLGFRDHLRSNDSDRDLYQRTKRDLATRTWRFVQDYADAKSEVVEEVIERAGL